MLEVGDGIHAFAHIVQAHIGVPIASAATHICGQHSISLRDQVLIERMKNGPCLALRSAMDVNDYGQSMTRSVRGQEEKGRDLTLIEVGIMDQRRLDKAFARDTSQRTARGLPEYLLLDIPDPDIHRCARRNLSQSQALAIRRPERLWNDSPPGLRR